MLFTHVFPASSGAIAPIVALYRTTRRRRALVARGPQRRQISRRDVRRLTMDPRQIPTYSLPGLWDFRRQGWTFRSGGDRSRSAPSGSAMYRSSDAGTTLDEDDRRRRIAGLPHGPWGRVELETIAPSNAQTEFTPSSRIRTLRALRVATTAGKRGKNEDRSQRMVWRPFYFAAGSSLTRPMPSVCSR